MILKCNSRFPNNVCRVSLLIVSFSLAMVSTSCAKFGGFFVGSQAGLGVLKGAHKQTDPAGRAGKVVLNETGLLGGLHAGYLSYIESSKVIFGGELYGNLTSFQSTKDLKVEEGITEGKVNLKQRYYFGAALMGGNCFKSQSYSLWSVGK